MNLNKALVISFLFLILLVMITIVNGKLSKDRQLVFESTSDKMVSMANFLFAPEIVRSYEKVKDIYGKKNILFFRYVNNSCDKCINSQLTEILTLQEEIGKDKVWIFPAYPDDRNSKIRLSNELAKYNYRNIPADSLLIPFYGGEQKSYFAWVNDEGEIEMVFIPEGNDVHYTRQYFLEVKKQLQKSPLDRKQ